MKKIGMYIHIPFCKKKCSYCDFISYVNKDEWIEEYIKCLKMEIEQVGKCNKEDVEKGIDELIEILHDDKKIHSEIMKKVASNMSLTRYEKTRYDGVRRFHYNMWFMQSEEENDEFRRKESTEAEVEQYLERQSKMKDELLYIFGDDEEVQGMILEQYNRVRTKTLVWPKVISKE